MNQHIPPTEPMDEQERELARIVRALPGAEPSAALDARILRAAVNAAAARRPGSRWLASSGALWGVGSAAAAVLALGVSWRMMYPEHSGAMPASAPAAQMADQAEESSVAVEFKDQPAREYDKSQPPALANAVADPRERRQSAQPAAPPQVMAAPVQSPEPFAGERLDEHVTASAELGAVADAQNNSPALAGRAEAGAVAADAVSAKSAVEQSREGELSAQKIEKATGTSAPEAFSAPATQSRTNLKPANWLADIRRLRDAGRTAEAKASLLEFHKRYPGLVIPSDLAPLLRE